MGAERRFFGADFREVIHILLRVTVLRPASIDPLLTPERRAGEVTILFFFMWEEAACASMTSTGTVEPLSVSAPNAHA